MPILYWKCKFSDYVKALRSVRKINYLSSRGQHQAEITADLPPHSSFHPRECLLSCLSDPRSHSKKLCWVLVQTSVQSSFSVYGLFSTCNPMRLNQIYMPILFLIRAVIILPWHSCLLCYLTDNPEYININVLPLCGPWLSWGSVKVRGTIPKFMQARADKSQCRILGTQRHFPSLQS